MSSKFSKNMMLLLIFSWQEWPCQITQDRVSTKEVTEPISRGSVVLDNSSHFKSFVCFYSPPFKNSGTFALVIISTTSERIPDISDPLCKGGSHSYEIPSGLTRICSQLNQVWEPNLVYVKNQCHCFGNTLAPLRNEVFKWTGLNTYCLNWLKSIHTFI